MPFTVPMFSRALSICCDGDWTGAAPQCSRHRSFQGGPAASASSLHAPLTDATATQCGVEARIQLNRRVWQGHSAPRPRAGWARCHAQLSRSHAAPSRSRHPAPSRPAALVPDSSTCDPELLRGSQITKGSAAVAARVFSGRLGPLARLHAHAQMLERTRMSHDQGAAGSPGTKGRAEMFQAPHDENSSTRDVRLQRRVAPACAQAGAFAAPATNSSMRWMQHDGGGMRRQFSGVVAVCVWQQCLGDRVVRAGESD